MRAWRQEVLACAVPHDRRLRHGVKHPRRLRRFHTRLCNDLYIQELADAVAGKLGGKVGVAPRIFLKKLVADVLDRIDQFSDFRPHEHYSLTIAESELTPVERQAMGVTAVDDIELDV
jgi:hypothetical protein